MGGGRGGGGGISRVGRGVGGAGGGSGAALPRAVGSGGEGKVGMGDLADKLHVAEDGGVARVVEAEAALELDHVTHRLPAADQGPVLRLDAGGVEGVRRRDLYAADLGRPALLYRLAVLDALPLQIREDFEVRDQVRARLLWRR